MTGHAPPQPQQGTDSEAGSAEDPKLWVALAAGLLAMVGVLIVALPRGPDLGGELVDGRDLVSCLDGKSSVPEPLWKVQVDERPVSVVSGFPSVVRVRVRSGDGEGESSVTSLLVLPTTEASEELASRVPHQDPESGGSGLDVDSWENVVVRRPDGELMPAPSNAATDRLESCVEEAATVASEPEGDFQECEPERISHEDLSVRGESCEAALARFEGRHQGEDHCAKLGPGFACFTEHICCALFAGYAGNGQVELVYTFGI